jgi:hypothetical protein
LTVAGVLRAHAAEYLAWRGDRASLQERRVLAQLVACRTAALGGHAWECDTCGAIRADYNSCGNRHCPTCRGAARAQWLERVRADLLPVPYFHVVQTLPHEPQLDRLVLANRALMYGLLFHSTSTALLELAADPEHLGARIGLLMVLHTWGQLMDPHGHVHVVVPGGGLSLDGQRWVACRDGFFLPVEVIGALVRGKFLAGLKRLWRAGKLKLDGKLSPLRAERTFESWLSTLYAKKWVAFAQGPPQGITGPDAVLKYLARYVSGVAISDRRLVSHMNGRVTFRWKNYARGGRSETTPPIAGVEFVRRYLLHVLPRGFVRIRSYGLLSNRNRTSELARCRTLLGAVSAASVSSAVSDPSACVASPTTSTPPPSTAANATTGSASSTCATCGRGRLVLQQSWPRPPVHELVARQSSRGQVAGTHRVPRPLAMRHTFGEFWSRRRCSAAEGSRPHAVTSPSVTLGSTRPVPAIAPDSS